VQGVTLTVGFLEPVMRSLADKILSHMNAWNKFCNVLFTLTNNPNDAHVRISLGSGGYWSYLGTDILMVPPNQQTMNLEGFNANTPDSEFTRVVRHETGHTLGFPHEHLRQEIVAKLDQWRTIDFFVRTQGWSEQEVIQQVLTPIESVDIPLHTGADVNSIMCYQLPGEITIDGRPIPGGTDIDQSDITLASKIYPFTITRRSENSPSDLKLTDKVA
jgi:hypothetical protein